MAKSIVVAVAGPHHDLKQAQSVLASVLKRGGCAACLSGLDIHFVNEVELFAHNANVSAQQLQLEG